MKERQRKKKEEREELMKTMDVHRRRKILVFSKNIIEAEQEVVRIRSYMFDQEHYDQMFFNQKQVSDLVEKIRENQSYIDSIYRRMGMDPLPPVYTININPAEEEEKK